MRCCNENRRGVISIEATIALSAFLFFMMFLYSLIFLVTGQETINTALVRSAESLALDSYAAESYDEPNESVNGFLTNIMGVSNAETTDFFSQEKWYSTNDEIENTVKARFYGYLAGGEGAAAELLAAVGVSDISFKGSQTDANGNLNIKLQYKIEPAFNFFDLLTQNVERSLCVKMWGKG